QGHGEDLGDRLDRELRVDVAGRVELALRRGEGDAEVVRRHLGERRDVVGVLAFVQALELVVGRLHGRIDRPAAGRGRRRLRRGPGGEWRRRCEAEEREACREVPARKRSLRHGLPPAHLKKSALVNEYFAVTWMRLSMPLDVLLSSRWPHRYS